MRRRRFLASATALLSAPLAGCGHPPVVLDMDEATADDIADEVTMRADPGTEEYSVMTSALENGSATRRGRRELFDRGPAACSSLHYPRSTTQNRGETSSRTVVMNLPAIATGAVLSRTLSEL